MPHTPGPSRLGHRMTDATLVETPQTSPARPEHDASSLTTVCLINWRRRTSSPINEQLQVTRSTRPPTTPHANEPSRTPIDKSYSHSQLTQSQQLASTSATKPSREMKETVASSSTSAGAHAENQFKSFKVSLEDPCWKVLPAALKKYKINDDWRKYVMFICHGSTGLQTLCNDISLSFF